MSEKKEKKKKIIGARIRVGVGNNVRFEDEEDVEVIGEDTTLIVSPEEAKEAEIIGEQIIVQVGAIFDSVFKQINEREDLNDETKEELKARVRELEKELEKKPYDETKIDRLKTFFKNNAPWLLPTIVNILDKILQRKP